MHAPGVAVELDAGGFDRHTFLCGQSGSGKSYSLGVVLEQLLLETDLRIVVLDPNSDCVRLPTVREGADPGLAARWRDLAQVIAVRSAAECAEHPLHRQRRKALADLAAAAAVVAAGPAWVVGRDDARSHHPRAPLDVAAGAEQGHHRGLHGGGDMHGGGIHADKKLRV